MMCQTATVFVRTRAASARAWSMARLWVTTRALRLSHLSASTPAKGASREEGIIPAKPTTPRSRAECVIR